jgi:glycosyltransferase involved in cell wall biosynthesis
MSVSVVIATYQRPDALARAVASVRGQSVPAELIVVPDETPREVYPTDSDAFWCVKGIPPRNQGLDRVTSDWVLVLDDDDRLAGPDALAQLLAASDGADVVYGRSYVDGAGLLGSWPPRPSGFVLGSVMWRADMGYRFRMDCAPDPADWDLWSRMLRDGRKWAFTDAVVHQYFPAERVPAVDVA